jgi:hypothetical protein
MLGPHAWAALTAIATAAKAAGSLRSNALLAMTLPSTLPRARDAQSYGEGYTCRPQASKAGGLGPARATASSAPVQRCDRKVFGRLP